MKKSDQDTDEVTPAPEAEPLVLAEPAPAVDAHKAEVRTAEAWAEAKGMLPEFIETQAPFAPAGSAPIRAHNPSHWKYNAIKAGHGWPLGKELTEAEFDAALLILEPTTGHQYR